MTTDKEFEFGKIKIEGNIVIGEMNEGIIFDLAANEKILQYCSEVFKDTPYSYISHRTHSYSIDPTVYLQVTQRTNIKAIAIVSGNYSESELQLEKQFFSNPFEYFQDLEAAKAWATQALSN